MKLVSQWQNTPCNIGSRFLAKRNTLDYIASINFWDTRCTIDEIKLWYKIQLWYNSYGIKYNWQNSKWILFYAKYTWHYRKHSYCDFKHSRQYSRPVYYDRKYNWRNSKQILVIWNKPGNKANIFFWDHKHNFFGKNYIAHIFLVTKNVQNKLADTFLKM